MDETDYYLELFRARSRRVRRTAILLASIVALMFVNAVSHIYQFDHYYLRLPGILYDFSRKYDQPLRDWWQEYRTRSPGLRSADARVIPIGDGVPDEQLVPVDSVPLLRAYLADNLPDPRYRETLLGWEIPTPLYLLVALFVPTALLLSMLSNLRFMRRTAVLLQSRVSASRVFGLIIASVLVDRITLGSRLLSRLSSVAAAVAFSLLAFGATALVIVAPVLTRHTVRGALYLGSSQFPQVVATPSSMGAPAGWLGLWIPLTITNAIICVFIANALANVELSVRDSK